MGGVKIFGSLFQQGLRICLFAALVGDAGAVLQAANAPDAVKLAGSLLHDARLRRAMSAAGRKLCQTHRGATERHLKLLDEVIRAATAPARG